MTQKTFVLTEISARFDLGDRFDFDQVYELCETGFRTRWPDNRHVRKSIHKNLQRLRKAGDIEFLGRGVYRLVGHRSLLD